MKKMYKAMALVLCAILLVVGSVMGTLAYLQMDTKTVTNTFTVGKVTITLKEYKLNDDGTKQDVMVDATKENQSLTGIKLVPSREIQKNPFVTVEAGSEKCYVFVKFENNIPEKYGTLNGFKDAWTSIDETNNIYVYTGASALNGVVDASTAAQKLDVFTSFTCADNITAYAGETDLAIKITAYAVQAEGFEQGGAAAWAATFGAQGNG